MSTHSPEPWRISGDTCKAFIVDKNDLDIACCDYGGNAEADANAARIVACVNACAGINPEAVPELLAACTMMRERLTDLANAADACWHDWPGAYAADAAIAKAQGLTARCRSCGKAMKPNDPGLCLDCLNSA